MSALRSAASARTGFADATTVRPIVHRTRGTTRGPITRLASPSDVGRLIKPFVFLDLFDAPVGREIGQGFGWHPHSGIATLTLPMEGQITYQESISPDGSIPEGGVEWMRASGGVWHTGGGLGDGPIRGFQLWVALPPELENEAAASQHLAPKEIPSIGPARLLLGRYGHTESPLALTAPSGINYLDVRLGAGERWSYRPPQGHLVGWIAVQQGELERPDRIGSGELVIFDRSEAAIEIRAWTDARFVLGSAVPHPYELALGYYSVHTSPAALEKGEREIARLGRALRVQGRLPAAPSKSRTN